jgi:hypothetical protein
MPPRQTSLAAMAPGRLLADAVLAVVALLNRNLQQVIREKVVLRRHQDGGRIAIGQLGQVALDPVGYFPGGIEPFSS